VSDDTCPLPSQPKGRPPLTQTVSGAG
jgi:hypothetical protein